MDTNDTISTLNGLIEACRDGQTGFQEAMTNIKNSDLKSLFAEASTERAKFLGELQEEVRSLGGD
ncbi:MAG: PA2169 family four-helix-bundle protein, partial [Blastocatellia bacterium]